MFRINQQQEISTIKEQNGSVTYNYTMPKFFGSMEKGTIPNPEQLESKSSQTLNIYTILMISSSLLDLLRRYIILKFAITASRNSHGKMVKSLISTIMSFFDNCFIGNILNRFSQDLSVIDDRLPMAMDGLLGVRSLIRLLY